MKIVIAPDSFTGFCSAAEAARLMSEGIAREAGACGIAPEIVLVPMADGGTGTLEVVEAASGGERVETLVKDPLGGAIDACYLRRPGGDVLVEMARASGIEHLMCPEDRRHPFLASTFGTGELLLHAASARPAPRRIVVALGGSATNDGGAGLAQALGARLLVARGIELPDRRTEGYGAAALLEATRADFSGLLELRGIDLVVACDVENPLLGPSGSTRVYGPQKGATPEMIPVLEEALQRWMGWVQAHRPQASPLAEAPGSGAAGGLGFALAALFGARLERGAAWVAGEVGLDEHLRGADLVVTGEGRLDAQSFMGKVVSEVATRARRVAPVARVVAVAGQVASELPEAPLLDHVVDASSGRRVAPAALAERGERLEDLSRAAAEALRVHLASPAPSRSSR